MSKIGLAITVSGRVQGVGFRWMTKMVADKLHIVGQVKNLDNGDVYIEAVGEPEAMTKFTAAVKASPTPSGIVDDYRETPLNDLPNFSRFNVTG